MNKRLIDIARDCGAAELPVWETCVIMGVSMTAFADDDSLSDAYRAGQLETKLRVRQAIVEKAKQGDVQAVKIYSGFAQAVLPLYRELNNEPPLIADTSPPLLDNDREYREWEE